MIDKPEIPVEEVRDTTVHDKKLTHHRLSQGIRSALLLSFLALFFTAAGIAAGYKHWQRMNDKAVANQSAIKQLQNQLQTTASADTVTQLRSDLDHKTTQVEQATAETLKEVARLQQQTQQAADTVAKQVEQITLVQARMQQITTPVSAQDWQIREIEYLLHIAQRELHLAQNVTTAIAALKEADALVGKLGLVDYLPVRQQISKDISALQGLNLPDLASISQQINALSVSLKPLPIVNGEQSKLNPSSANKAEANETDNSQESSWEKYKRQALSSLRETIVVRQLDQPIQAQLDSSSRATVYQLLLVQLENLRLFAVQRMDSAYHEQIALLRTTISTYYPAEQAKISLAELDALNKYTLQVKLPDISASVQQLDNARQAELAKEATTPAVKEKSGNSNTKPSTEGKGGKGQ